MKRKVNSPPDYLFIQLKRFEYQKLKKTVEKISTEIEFPKDGIVNIQTTAQEDPLKYEIISCVNHEGDQANVGHYTSYVKSTKDNNWYNCDDEDPRKKDNLPNSSAESYIFVLKKTT